ncbi:MAG: hypothetical protein LC102_09580 [Ignavibacteriales bacterium]|nr:MAG: hypothetical protein F9K26_01210 [Ignavibacteriaceae bacterium]MBW7872028.1 hypothetical protein [Ignavibacteria bacterium]MCZ2143663.1 hypothetical protein [Ignavibacteriales bacterium]OQY72805.1 MAG: hypothetical protein B6D45_08765 [Ignavibacteriales bacterium UTCHB3]MBV6446074.1 hypothetical protein [Ignavibacteriaceae bacterium]
MLNNSSFLRKLLHLHFIILFVALFSFAGCDKGAAHPGGEPGKEGTENETPESASGTKIDLSKYDLHYNDMAKILGGLEVEPQSKYFNITKEKAWQKHKEFFSTKWKNLENNILDSVKTWTASELSVFDPNAKTVFYPFGGPDFLFANLFFPNANLYILQGLEPVNRLPDDIKSNDSSLRNYLTDLQNSLRVLTVRGYFITNQMSKDLKQGIFRGVLPVMLLFLAKTENTVLDVKYILQDGNGDFKLNDADLLTEAQLGKNSAKGCVVYFTDKDQKEVKKLYYFSTDTQNPSWEKLKNLQKLITENGKIIFFAKAASYLLHGHTFSALRDFILNNASYLLQTDTGIPVKYLKDNWNMTYYGTYIKPIADFPWAYQADLKAIYNDSSKIKHMPFGICYRWKKEESHIMRGIKK